jgi:hypothetical protein
MILYLVYRSKLIDHRPQVASGQERSAMISFVTV